MRRFGFLVLVAAAILVAAMGVGCTVFGGQSANYPTKSVELVVPYAAGGGTDLLARAFAPVLSDLLKQPVVVVNKAASRLDGGLYTAQAKPDGYTIATMPPGIAWPEVHYKEYPYTSEQLVPVARIATYSLALLVRADQPIKTVQDLVAAAKAQPGLRYAHTGVGASPHLVMAAFSRLAKIDTVPVPFSGDAGAIAALAGGNATVGVTTFGAPTIAQIKAGTVRALAVFAAKRESKAPDVPTFAELGYDLGLPLFDLTLYVPKGTPDEIVKILDKDVQMVDDTQSFKDYLDSIAYTPAYISGEEYKNTVMAKQKPMLGSIMKELDLLK